MHALVSYLAGGCSVTRGRRRRSSGWGVNVVTRTGWKPAVAAALWLLPALSAVAQPASSQPVLTVEQAAQEARRWVAQPARDERIESFGPAADIRYRVYENPRPLRVWIARIDLSAPGLRLALTEPAGPVEDDPSFETRCANTLEFAMQRGVQLAVNTSAFDPFRPFYDRAGRGGAVSGCQPDTGDRRYPELRQTLHGRPTDAARNSG